MIEMPVAYEGKEPYIFISYAHKNTDRVMPIIAGLQSRGFRVWYDAGIETGLEWAESVVSQLEKCWCVVALVTREYLKSESCRDELHFAKERNKPISFVYLEEVKLPVEMLMSFGRFPATDYYRYRNAEAFLDVLCSADALQPCHKGAGVISQKIEHVQSTVHAEASFEKTVGAGKARYAFVSYSTKNQEEADLLRKLMEREGIPSWMAPYDIPTGSKYPAEITKAIRGCACLVLVLSDAAQNSEAVDREVELATITFSKPIVAVQIEELTLNDSFMFYLKSRQIERITDLSKDTPQRKKILSALRNHIL